MTIRFAAVMLVLLFGVTVHAQHSNLLNSSSYYEKYLHSNSPKDLKRARQKIDAASVHPDTRMLAQTWLVRGNVYYAVYAQESSKTRDSILDIAAESYLHGKQLDTLKGLAADLVQGIMRCDSASSAAGTRYYYAHDYHRASDCFYRSYLLNAGLGKTDSSVIYSAALSSLKAKKFARTTDLARILIAERYYGSAGWWLVAEADVQSGDTLGARLAVDSGLVQFPGDGLLKRAKMDVLLASGNFRAADEFIRINYIGKDSLSSFEQAYFTGYRYAEFASHVSKDDSTRSWNHEQYYVQAERNYQKAIELSPDSFGVRYNLAVLHYNQALYYFEQQMKYGLNCFPDQKWQGSMQKAEQAFEAARLLQPDHPDVLRALERCYTLYDPEGKLGAIKQLIKQLEQK